MQFSTMMLHAFLSMTVTLCLVSKAVATICEPPPAGMVSWWQGHDNAHAMPAISIADSPGQGVPAAAFTAQVAIKFGPHPHDVFEMSACFTLDVDSDGIHPCTEDVTLTVGPFATTIPTGSFRQEAQGQCSFVGVIDGVRLVVLLWPVGSGRYQVHAVGTNADLTGTVNPVEVGLRMGKESGRTTVTARFL